MFDNILSAKSKQRFSYGTTRLGGAMKTYMKSGVHEAGMHWVKGGFGFGAQLKGAGPVGRIGIGALALYTMHHAGRENQRKGGSYLWGAGKQGVEYAAQNYAIGAGMRALGLTGHVGAIATGVGVGVAAIAGTTYASATGINPITAALRPLVYNKMMMHGKLEMGHQVADPYGNAATMRQRSLAAMQDSKFNGRTALGNEATYMYRSYFR